MKNKKFGGKAINIVGSFFRADNEIPRGGKLKSFIIYKKENENSLIPVETLDWKDAIPYFDQTKFKFDKYVAKAEIDYPNPKDRNNFITKEFVITPRFYRITHYNKGDTEMKNPEPPYNLFEDRFTINNNQSRQLIQRFSFTYGGITKTYDIKIEVIPQVIKLESISVKVIDPTKFYYSGEIIPASDLIVKGKFKYKIEGKNSITKEIELEQDPESSGSFSNDKFYYSIKYLNTLNEVATEKGLIPYNIDKNDEGRANFYVEYKKNDKILRTEPTAVNTYGKEKIPELIVKFDSGKSIYYNGEKLDVGTGKNQKFTIKYKYPHDKEAQEDISSQLPCYIAKNNGNAAIKSQLKMFFVYHEKWGIAQKEIDFGLIEENESLRVLDEYGTFKKGNYDGYFDIRIDYYYSDKNKDECVSWHLFKEIKEGESDSTSTIIQPQVYKFKNGKENCKIKYKNGVIKEVPLVNNSQLKEEIIQTSVGKNLLTDCIEGIILKRSHNIWVGVSDASYELIKYNGNNWELGGLQGYVESIKINALKINRELFDEKYNAIKKGNFSENSITFEIKIAEKIGKLKEEDKEDKFIYYENPTQIGLLKGEVTIEIKEIFIEDYVTSQKCSYNFTSDIIRKRNKYINDMGASIFNSNKPDEKNINIFNSNSDTLITGISKLELYKKEDENSEGPGNLINIKLDKSLKLERGYYTLKLYALANDAQIYKFKLKGKEPTETYEINIKVFQNINLGINSNYSEEGTNISGELISGSNSEISKYFSAFIRIPWNNKSDPFEDFYFKDLYNNNRTEHAYSEDFTQKASSSDITFTHSGMFKFYEVCNETIMKTIKYTYDPDGFDFKEYLQGRLPSTINLQFSYNVRITEKIIEDPWIISNSISDLKTAINKDNYQKFIEGNHIGDVKYVDGIKCCLVEINNNELIFIYKSQGNLSADFVLMGNPLGSFGTNLGCLDNTIETDNDQIIRKKCKPSPITRSLGSLSATDLVTWVPDAREMGIGSMIGDVIYQNQYNYSEFTANCNNNNNVAQITNNGNFYLGNISNKFIKGTNGGGWHMLGLAHYTEGESKGTAISLNASGNPGNTWKDSAKTKYYYQGYSTLVKCFTIKINNRIY